MWLTMVVLAVVATTALAAPVPEELPSFPRPVGSYGDEAVTNLGEKLLGRIQADPFNLVATVLFILAITHTFLASKFMKIAHRYERLWKESSNGAERDRLRFRSTLFHFLGEVEAVFGLWAIPLAAAIAGFYGWSTMIGYFDNANYTEPIFVFVVMAIAGSKPILRFAENALSVVAGLGGRTPAAWWISILTVGPLLGSFITEPAAMTICALLLLQQFYRLEPPMGLRYATLGLLFVNISVGGTLTHFAAPPVVMVANKWGWDLAYMFTNFGWKAIVGVLVANALYFTIHARQLLTLKPREESKAKEDAVPMSVTVIHLLAIVWTVLNAHHPVMVIIGLLFFLAYVVATERHQNAISLRGPMLVGFFLAALVIHGGCQQWWIAPVLGDLTRWPLMIGATLLTAVNDNAAITYLATLVPGFTEELKYAVVAGAVTGGGLTVIANAPNPAGQSILSKAFGEGGVSPLRLFLAALIPTIIMGAAFMLLP